MNGKLNSNANPQTRPTRPTTAVLATLFVLRLINAFTVQTFFQPDEYFQALEPAWQMAFGPDSGAWITWEWRQHIRSSLHPMLFAAVYKAAARLSDLIGAEPTTMATVLITTPKLLQAVIAAIGDFYTWQLSCRVYGQSSKVSWSVLALTALSPWQSFCSVRTFSNSLETVLTVIGLYYWPWDWLLKQSDKRRRPAVTANGRRDIDKEANGDVQDFKDFLEGKIATSSGPQLHSQTAPATAVPDGLYSSLIAAALACILRPTNIIIWATIAITMAYRYSDEHQVATLAQAGVLCGSAVLAMSIAVDYAYYGVFTLPALKFLYLNVVNALSSFYGTNRLDYYFTEGLHLLLTTALPFALAGLWQSLRPGLDKPGLRGYEERQIRFVLAVAVLVTVLAFTMLAHKEVRFIYPLLPMLHILAAKPMTNFFIPFPVPQSKVKLGFMALLFTVNVYIAAYVSLVHQRGVIDVLHYLRHEQEARLQGSRGAVTAGIQGFADGHKNITVGFFMPCHSTPWRSHLVYPEIQAWALTCEPPLNLTLDERQWYLDEADVFYAHPGAWIDGNMADRRTIMKNPKSASVARNRGRSEIERVKEGEGDRRPWPDYLTFFEHLEPVMNSVLEDTRYRECWRGFNTHWHDDLRRQGDIVVWCMKEDE